jgi:hypothetical protein
LPDFYGVSLLQEQQSDGIGMGGCTVFGAGAICKEFVMLVMVIDLKFGTF